MNEKLKGKGVKLKIMEYYFCLIKYSNYLLKQFGIDYL